MASEFTSPLNAAIAAIESLLPTERELLELRTTADEAHRAFERRQTEVRSAWNEVFKLLATCKDAEFENSDLGRAIRKYQNVF